MYGKSTGEYQRVTGVCGIAHGVYGRGTGVRTRVREDYRSSHKSTGGLPEFAQELLDVSKHGFRHVGGI